MPAKVIWAPSGLDDLEAAITHIARDNVSAAVRFGETCLARIDQLAEFPRLGKPYAATAAGEIHELIVAPYRLFYRINSENQTVHVLRVWHASRGTPRLP